MDKLTPREIEVANCVIQGMKAKEIAAKLGISDKTVEQHKEHIYRKLNVHNMVQMARKVLRG